MPTIQYELNCGQYVMLRDGQGVTGPLDEVAVAFSVTDDGMVLHKHGEPKFVEEWVLQSKRRLATRGAAGQQMADELRIVKGALPLQTLNDALQGAHRAKLALQAFADQAGSIDVETRVITEVDAGAPAGDFRTLRPIG